MIAQVELEITRENPTPEQMWEIRTAIRNLIPSIFDGLPQVGIAPTVLEIGEPSIVEEAAA